MIWTINATFVVALILAVLPWRRSRSAGLLALQVIFSSLLLLLVAACVGFHCAPHFVPEDVAQQMAPVWEGLRSSHPAFPMAAAILGSPWLVLAIAATIGGISLILEVRRQRRQVDHAPVAQPAHSRTTSDSPLLLKHHLNHVSEKE